MSTQKLWSTLGAVCACLALLVLAAMPAFAQAVSTTVVISQVYGGGGNVGSVYKNDFIELHNVSSSPVPMTNWSVQYASATGSSWNVTPINGTIPAGGYFLVQEAAGTGGTTNLPTPEATGNIAMSGTAGKVALVNGTTALSGACPTGGALVDFVGFGSANCFEGTGPTAAPNNSNSVLRAGNGCTDTGNNATDFSAVLAAPRNSASPTAACGVVLPTNPSGSGSATTVLQNSTTTLTVTVTPGQNPVSSGIAVTGDLTAIGGAAAVPFSNGGSGNVYTYTQLVTDAVAAGTKSVIATITDAENRTGTVTISVNVVAPAPEYAIHDVQGSGNASTIAGQRVSVNGIVVGLAKNGFYLEAPESGWDSDPLTSEGVFVFTSSAPGVVVHDGVQVIGQVQEYKPSGATLTTTEIAGTPAVVLLSQGNTLPTAIGLVPDPKGTVDQFERYEGMLVELESPQVTGPTGGGTTSNGTFYVTANTLARPFREPGVEPGIALPAGMPANAPKFDGNPERLKIDSSACVTPATVAVHDAVPTVTGPLAYSGDFAIVACPAVTSTRQSEILPAPAANEFTVGSFNMLNFTNNSTRIAKASRAIREVMRSPDVIGVEEMADLATLQALRDRLNTDLGSSIYEAKLPLKVGTQNVGFLYRTDRLTGVSVEAVGADALMPDNKNVVNDRAPVVMTAQVKPDAGAGYPVTVIVNHLRSLIDVDTVGASGDFARTKRQWGSEYLANLIAKHQASGERVIAVGDFNAYEFNDGYVDVLGTVTGNPASADQVLLASPSLVSPKAVDLIAELPAAKRYTYVENGNAQALDHIVATQNLLAAPYHLEVAHNNAEFPESWLNDGTKRERVSDHDMPVAYFTLPPTADAVTPTGGAGDATLTFTFSDRGGYAVLSGVQAIIGPSVSYSGTCAVYYLQAQNQLTLNRDGGGWLPPAHLGSSTTLSNSQCTVNVAGSSVTTSGIALNLNLALSFSPTFAGVQNIYGVALDSTTHGEWRNLGTWMPAPPVFVPQAVSPTVDSVSPDGSIGAKQNLTFQFSSVNGASYIEWVQGIVGNSVQYANNCSFYYQRSKNLIYLMNDAGTTWVGPMTAGSAGTLTNSQCSIDVGATTVSANGNSLALTLAVTGTAKLLDAQKIYAYASDHSNLRSGWVQLGTWTPNVAIAEPPTVQSIVNSTTGAAATFSDVNGASYIGWVQLIVGTTFGYANSCSIYYVPQTNRLYLMNDAGTTWQGPVYPGQFGTLSNAQCSINAKGTTVTLAGNDLTINVAATTTTGFKGARNAWGFAVDGAGRKSNWINLGPFTVQ